MTRSLHRLSASEFRARSQERTQMKAAFGSISGQTAALNVFRAILSTPAARRWVSEPSLNSR